MNESEPPKQSIINDKLNLTLTSILLISLLFTIPVYNHWIFDNVLSPNARIKDQMTMMDDQKRMEYRFGATYIEYENITAVFKKINAKDVVLLLPPNDYLVEEKIKDFHSVEPAEFYYFTGYKAVWADSPDAGLANWAVVIHDHKAVLNKIRDKASLDLLLTEYKKYNLTL